MFDDTPQAVAVRYHQDFVVNGQFGENHALPVGQRPFDGLLERFGAGQLLVRDPGVAGIEARIAGIVFGQRIGCDVVAAPPDVHLLFAEAGRRFALVEPLQYAVMFLVEAPVFLDGDPFLIEPVENTVQGPDGPFQVGGVGFAETESFGFEQFSGFEGLFDAFVREIDVRPSREAVFAVPRAFAVPQQYDFFHGMICFYLYFTSLRHSPWENA